MFFFNWGKQDKPEPEPKPDPFCEVNSRGECIDHVWSKFVDERGKQTEYEVCLRCGQTR